MDAIVVLALFLALAAASLRWGHESRPGFALTEYDAAKERIEGLLVEARLQALVRGPGWSQRVGGWLIATGCRLQAYGESVVSPARLAATSDGSIQSGL